MKAVRFSLPSVDRGLETTIRTISVGAEQTKERDARKNDSSSNDPDDDSL